MGIFGDIFTKKNANIKWYKVFDSEKEAQEQVLLNKAVTVLIEDQKICLARNLKGFFAVSDICPHLGASLSKGVCNNFMEIVCPWHNYRFDLISGSENTQTRQYKVETFPIKLDSSGLFIGILLDGKF